MIKKALGLALALTVGIVIKVGWPDIRRYLKIKQVSAQRAHPEMVPVQGRAAYPEHHDDGAPDGSGDFDSAHRGGPARTVHVTTAANLKPAPRELSPASRT